MWQYLGPRLIIEVFVESFHQSLDGTISLSGAQPCEEDAGGGQLQDKKSNLFFLVF